MDLTKGIPTTGIKTSTTGGPVNALTLEAEANAKAEAKYKAVDEARTVAEAEAEAVTVNRATIVADNLAHSVGAKIVKYSCTTGAFNSVTNAGRSINFSHGRYQTSDPEEIETLAYFVKRGVIKTLN